MDVDDKVLMCVMLSHAWSVPDWNWWVSNASVMCSEAFDTMSMSATCPVLMAETHLCVTALHSQRPKPLGHQGAPEKYII